jgi:hypothetical protein
VTRDLDFVQFWTAANCCVTGGNPYNSGHFTERLLSVAPARYKVLGWAYTPAFVYAPNILPFLAPLGVLDLDTAAWVWRMANICALLIGLRFAILWLGSRPKSWWKFRLGATVLEPEPSGMLCRVHVNVKH